MENYETDPIMMQQSKIECDFEDRLAETDSTILISEWADSTVKTSYILVNLPECLISEWANPTVKTSYSLVNLPECLWSGKPKKGAVSN